MYSIASRQVSPLRYSQALRVSESEDFTPSRRVVASRYRRDGLVGMSPWPIATGSDPGCGVRMSCDLCFFELAGRVRCMIQHSDQILLSGLVCSKALQEEKATDTSDRLSINQLGGVLCGLARLLLEALVPCTEPQVFIVAMRGKSGSSLSIASCQVLASVPT